jgi:hypothetical protein
VRKKFQSESRRRDGGTCATKILKIPLNQINIITVSFYFPLPEFPDSFIFEKIQKISSAFQNVVRRDDASVCLLVSIIINRLNYKINFQRTMRFDLLQILKT